MKNKKVLTMLIAGVMILSLSACKQNKENEVKVEEQAPKHALYDKSMAEQPAVDQVQKAYLEKDESFGNLSLKVSNAWNKFEEEDVTIYMLNEEKSSHIQLQTIKINKKIEDKDLFDTLKNEFKSYFNGNAIGDIREKNVNGITMYGQEGSLSTKESSFNVITYYMINNKDSELYRFSLITEGKISEEDEAIFLNMLGTLKLK